MGISTHAKETLTEEQVKQYEKEVIAFRNPGELIEKAKKAKTDWGMKKNINEVIRIREEVMKKAVALVDYYNQQMDNVTIISQDVLSDDDAIGVLTEKQIQVLDTIQNKDNINHIKRKKMIMMDFISHYHKWNKDLILVCKKERIFLKSDLNEDERTLSIVEENRLLEDDEETAEF